MIYPTNSGAFEDKNILRNAFEFTTKQRGGIALRIIEDLATNRTHDELAELIIEAFQQYVVGLEDMLGWYDVLRKWQPGKPQTSLMALLDTVNVTADLEETLLKSLEELDSLAYRQAIHVPLRAELKASLFSEDFMNMLDKAMEAQLSGLKVVARRRQNKERAIVRAYNKSKHMLLAIKVLEKGQPAVWLATADGGKSAYSGPQISMGGAILLVNATDVRRYAFWAVSIQATLNSIFRLLLETRYGVSLPIPAWVHRMYRLPDWNTDAQ